MAGHEDVGANPWPGYVDALSTIIMVFIFLVILLGIVITALSQNIARQMAEAKSDARQARQELQDHIIHQFELQQQSEQKTKEQKAREPGAQGAQGAPQQPAAQSGKAAAQRARIEEGSFAASAQQAMTADQQVAGSDKVAVLSREIDETQKVAVGKSDGATGTERKVLVESAQAALRLVFENGIRISEAASAEIAGYMQAHPDFAQTGKIEIWAFANPTRSSISEARRTAYYRGLLVRNEMMHHGFTSDRISLKVSISQREEDRDTVKVFAK
jgi:hypothetical protein